MKNTIKKPEPQDYVYTTKAELLNAWSEWFESKREDWDLFALTVVFKSGGSIPRPDRWESEYKTRVLAKIRRRIERNKKNYEFAIPFDEFAYYEKDEASIHRITGSRKPHHIHALVPIRKEQLYRFWSIDSNDIHPALRKDIESINTVQSIVIERIIHEKTGDWVRYVLKMKQI